jgi:uracil phosphoribosyltransferase
LQAGSKYRELKKLMGNVCVLDHPLIQHKLSLIRDESTKSKEFRELVEEVAMLMAYEVTRDFPLEEVEVRTPVGISKAKRIAGRKVALVPILRAGLGMVDGMLKLIPAAKVGHIGLYRDPETLRPVEYYCKMPYDLQERDIIIIDPMLATGGSAAAAISFIKDRGGKRIKLMCLIAAPEGIKTVHDKHPDVDIFVAAKDERLNEHAYIVPGLGDAGDRLFGTK